MSSEILPTEKVDIMPTGKSVWTAHVKTSTDAYRFIQERAKREERSVSYVVSKILEAYYEERTKLKVV